MENDLKKNMCNLIFDCNDSGRRPCVNFKQDETPEYKTLRACAHCSGDGCESSIAKTNSMVLELKKIGVGLIPIGQFDEIKSKLRLAVERNGLKPVEEVLNILEDL